MTYRYHRLLIILFIATVLVGCAIEQNNVTSNVYHNITAHFNGYYYALEKTHEVEAVILKSLDDDHNLVLRLFPKLDTTLAKSYEKGYRGDYQNGLDLHSTPPKQ